MSAERQRFSPRSSASPPGPVEGFGGVDPRGDPLPEMETVRMFVHERLAAAVDDILGVFVETVSRYREQIDRQRRQLDSLRTEEGRWSPAAGRCVSPHTFKYRSVASEYQQRVIDIVISECGY